MKVAILQDEIYKLPITSGTVQNIGNVSIEITDTQEKDTGIIIEPWEKFSFRDTQLFAYAKRGAYIAVVPFEKSAGRWDLKQIDDMSEFMQGINKLANAKQVKAELGIEGMTAAELADGTITADKEISPKLLVEYVSGVINSLINNAPAALDTLNELAAALGDDENFAATMTTELSKKLGKNETAVNAAKVNNLTVETAVPANAVFTDTTYSPATTTNDGLMSASDKVKLSTLETELSNKLGKKETAVNAAKVNNLTVETAVPANAVFTDTTYGAATQSAAGLMSAADKTKLDGVDTKANAYSLPTASSSTLGGVKIGSNVTITNGVISVSGTNVKAALGTGSGTSKYLREDGSWATPPDNNTTYSPATTTQNGLMSASDKTKLNNVKDMFIVDSAGYIVPRSAAL